MTLPRRAFLLSSAAVASLFIALRPWKRGSLPHDSSDLSVLLALYGIEVRGLEHFLRDLDAISPAARGRLLPWWGHGANRNESIIRGLLLSSEIEQRGEQRLVRYQRLFDPYTQPCANPFARLT